MMTSTVPVSVSGEEEEKKTRRKLADVQSCLKSGLLSSAEAHTMTTALTGTATQSPTHSPNYSPTHSPIDTGTKTETIIGTGNSKHAYITQIPLPHQEKEEKEDDGREEQKQELDEQGSEQKQEMRGKGGIKRVVQQVIQRKIADLERSRDLGLITAEEFESLRAQVTSRATNKSSKSSSTSSGSELETKLADLSHAQMLGLISPKECTSMQEQLRSRQKQVERTALSRGYEGGVAAGFGRGFDSVDLSPLQSSDSSLDKKEDGVEDSNESFLAGYEAGFVAAFNRGLALRAKSNEYTTHPK